MRYACLTKKGYRGKSALNLKVLKQNGLSYSVKNVQVCRYDKIQCVLQA